METVRTWYYDFVDLEGTEHDKFGAVLLEGISLFITVIERFRAWTIFKQMLFTVG